MAANQRMTEGTAPRERPERPWPTWDQALIVTLLLTASALCWAWMIAEARTPEANAAAMLTHDMAMDNAVAVIPPRVYAAASVPMWFFMMVAMMVPTATPMVAAFARYSRSAGEPLTNGWLFALSYVSVWGLFSVAASIAQTVLVETGLLQRSTLMLGNDRLAGLLMMGVGLYQLTPAKFRFIEHCRAPLPFLNRFWRPGPTEALVIGFRHAMYCLGSSWLLMSLLFVGGAMSLIWALSLAGLVGVEKSAPLGRQVGAVAGVVCLLTGVGLVFRLF